MDPCHYALAIVSDLFDDDLDADFFDDPALDEAFAMAQAGPVAEATDPGPTPHRLH